MKIEPLFPTFLFFVFYSSSNLVDTPISQEIVELKSGELYWWAEKLGALRNVEEHENELIGEVQGTHEYIKFCIKKELVQDPQAKTNSAKKAIQQLIDTMKWNKDLSQLAQDYRRRLRFLTAIDLENADQWQRWFEENGDYVV